MNKWEDSFKCHCSDNQGLFIPNRQLSALVAVVLLLAFSIFMTGYFLGKRKVIEQFTQEMQHDAVADKIYTTLLSTSSSAPSFAESFGGHGEATKDMQPTSDILLVTNTEEIVSTSQLMSHEKIATTEQATIVSLDTQRYYAQLIGFGTEKAAQSFIKKLAAKGIETELKKRASKTAKGNTSYWYQVVTAQYAHKDDLLHLVDKLTKEENIKDARICVC